MIKSSITFTENNLPQLMQHESNVIILVAAIEVDTDEDTEQEWVSGTIVSHFQKDLIGRFSINEYLLSKCTLFHGIVTLSNS